MTKRSQKCAIQPRQPAVTTIGRRALNVRSTRRVKHPRKRPLKTRTRIRQKKTRVRNKNNQVSHCLGGDDDKWLDAYNDKVFSIRFWFIGQNIYFQEAALQGINVSFFDFFGKSKGIIGIHKKSPHYIWYYYPNKDVMFTLKLETDLSTVKHEPSISDMTVILSNPMMKSQDGGLTPITQSGGASIGPIKRYLSNNSSNSKVTEVDRLSSLRDCLAKNSKSSSLELKNNQINMITFQNQKNVENPRKLKIKIQENEIKTIILEDGTTDLVESQKPLRKTSAAALRQYGQHNVTVCSDKIITNFKELFKPDSEEDKRWFPEDRKTYVMMFLFGYPLHIGIIDIPALLLDEIGYNRILDIKRKLLPSKQLVIEKNSLLSRLKEEDNRLLRAFAVALIERSVYFRKKINDYVDLLKKKTSSGHSALVGELAGYLGDAIPVGSNVLSGLTAITHVARIVRKLHQEKKHAESLTALDTHQDIKSDRFKLVYYSISIPPRALTYAMTYVKLNEIIRNMLSDLYRPNDEDRDDLEDQQYTSMNLTDFDVNTVEVNDMEEYTKSYDFETGTLRTFDPQQLGKLALAIIQCTKEQCNALLTDTSVNQFVKAEGEIMKKTNNLKEALKQYEILMGKLKKANNLQTNVVQILLIAFSTALEQHRIKLFEMYTLCSTPEERMGLIKVFKEYADMSKESTAANKELQWCAALINVFEACRTPEERRALIKVFAECTTAEKCRTLVNELFKKSDNVRKREILVVGILACYNSEMQFYAHSVSDILTCGQADKRNNMLIENAGLFVFKSLDIDNEDQLDLFSISHILSHTEQREQRQKIFNIFVKADGNNDTLIDRNEFKVAFDKIAKCASGTEDASDDEDAQGASDTKNQDMIRELITIARGIRYVRQNYEHLISVVDCAMFGSDMSDEGNICPQIIGIVKIQTPSQFNLLETEDKQYLFQLNIMGDNEQLSTTCIHGFIGIPDMLALCDTALIQDMTRLISTDSKKTASVRNSSFSINFSSNKSPLSNTVNKILPAFMPDRDTNHILTKLTQLTHSVTALQKELLKLKS